MYHKFLFYFILKKNYLFKNLNYRGRKLDKERFIYTHKKYNVPSRGRDQGPIAQNVQSNKRKGNVITSKIIFKLIKKLSFNFNLIIY